MILTNQQLYEALKRIPVQRRADEPELLQKELTYQAFFNEHKYYQFSIPKKNGKPRIINAPYPRLRFVQRKINAFLSVKFQAKEAATGFIKGRSIVTNAKKHTNKKFLLNIDLENFFPSIHFGRVKAVLQLSPVSFSTEIASLVANICCMDGTLPQGAPTSPTISNMVCQRLDRKMIQLGKNAKFHYSRYADDMSFSSNKNVFNEELISKISEIIHEEGFKVNEDKLRQATFFQRQEVTGLIVNEKVNIKRAYIKELRAILHNWKTKGFTTTMIKYCTLKGRVDAINQDVYFLKSIKGKINYLKMIRGKDDYYFLKFMVEYYSLLGDMEATRKWLIESVKVLGIDVVLDRIMEDGINRTNLKDEDYLLNILK